MHLGGHIFVQIALGRPVDAGPRGLSRDNTSLADQDTVRKAGRCCNITSKSWAVVSGKNVRAVRLWGATPRPECSASVPTWWVSGSLGSVHDTVEVNTQDDCWYCWCGVVVPFSIMDLWRYNGTGRCTVFRPSYGESRRIRPLLSVISCLNYVMRFWWCCPNSSSARVRLCCSINWVCFLGNAFLKSVLRGKCSGIFSEELWAMTSPRFV